MARRSFRVLWAEAAARDLNEIVAYVAADSPANAERVLLKIEKRAASLADSPERGRVVPELSRFGMRAWRELVVRPYRLIYRIDGSSVLVLVIFDGRRDIEDVLLERLTRIT